MSIAIKIRMHPHIILSESISCRRSAENKTPKTDSNDRKSDAIAEFTYFKHTFCITKQISVLNTPRYIIESITRLFIKACAGNAPS